MWWLEELFGIEVNFRYACSTSTTEKVLASFSLTK
jgi:hypothetical protein